jgi:hypothetical protein
MMAIGVPEDFKKDLKIWASCISGAIDLQDYLNKMKSTGFSQIKVVNQEEYSNKMILEFIQNKLENEENEAAKQKILKTIKLYQEDISKIKISHAEISAIKES